jgi:O-antigen/teichoic acid export membrane protein
MNSKIGKLAETFKNSKLLKNSFWGIASNILQNVFVSLFFLILARKYLPEQFAHFLVANTMYQIVAAFSAMGLGQWFIREYVHANDTSALTKRFLKFQFIFGIIFYFINILIVYLLYKEPDIRMLSIVFGLNVLFDNVIYGIKHLNIAEFKQEKTFVILIIDALLRLLAGCVLFFEPISVLTLSIILVAVRFITLNLFFKVGSSNTLTPLSVFRHKTTGEDIKNLIRDNWTFVVIGSVSIIFWRMASVVVSKMLMAIDLANYEISFKIFSIAQVIPLITSASVYPMLVKKYQSNGVEGIQSIYRTLFIIYAFFGLLCYTFIYSFSDAIIPFLFGSQYTNNPVFTKQMFLTILVFPTALLQANIIVAMKHERTDMIFNVLVLVINLIGCIAGIYYFRTLSVVNYAIFISFLIFHILQDAFLIKLKIAPVREVLLIYLFFGALVTGYMFLADKINPYLLFTVFCIGMGAAGYFLIKKYKNIESFV